MAIVPAAAQALGGSAAPARARDRGRGSVLREVPITIGRPERGQLVEAAQQLEVVLDGLAEADPRVEQDPLARRCPRATANAQALLEERLDLVDDVVVARVVLHRARLAAACASGSSPRPPSATSAGHLRVGAQRADVVDERRARRRARPRRPPPWRCRSRSAAAGAARAPRSPARRARSSSSAPTGSAPGPRRLAADVEDVGALARPARAPCATAALGVEEAPAVGERVGRHVEDPHQAEGRRPCARILAARVGILCRMELRRATPATRRRSPRTSRTASPRYLE